MNTTTNNQVYEHSGVQSIVARGTNKIYVRFTKKFSDIFNGFGSDENSRITAKFVKNFSTGGGSIEWKSFGEDVLPEHLYDFFTEINSSFSADIRTFIKQKSSFIEFNDKEHELNKYNVQLFGTSGNFDSIEFLTKRGITLSSERYEDYPLTAFITIKQLLLNNKIFSNSIRGKDPFTQEDVASILAKMMIDYVTKTVYETSFSRFIPILIGKADKGKSSMIRLISIPETYNSVSINEFFRAKNRDLYEMFEGISLLDIDDVNMTNIKKIMDISSVLKGVEGGGRDYIRARKAYGRDVTSIKKSCLIAISSNSENIVTDTGMEDRIFPIVLSDDTVFDDHVYKEMKNLLDLSRVIALAGLKKFEAGFVDSGENRRNFDQCIVENVINVSRFGIDKIKNKSLRGDLINVKKIYESFNEVRDEIDRELFSRYIVDDFDKDKIYCGEARDARSVYDLICDDYKSSGVGDEFRSTGYTFSLSEFYRILSDKYNFKRRTRNDQTKGFLHKGRWYYTAGKNVSRKEIMTMFKEGTVQSLFQPE